MVIIITEEILSEGSPGLSENVLLQADDVPHSFTLMKENIAERAANDKGDYQNWFKVSVHRELLSPCVIKSGDSIASCVRQKISDLLEPNAAFLDTTLPKCLIPCVTFHYFARCEHL